MPDKDRITSLDCQFAHSEWKRMMNENLANIRREPVNADAWTQAHWENLMEGIRRENDARKASAPPSDPDPSTSTPTRP